jgi:hypothetical protein
MILSVQQQNQGMPPKTPLKPTDEKMNQSTMSDCAATVSKPSVDPYSSKSSKPPISSMNTSFKGTKQQAKKQIDNQNIKVILLHNPPPGQQKNP